jgi:predicted RNA-binding Zn-ribbon protein involved in translation (DUF1610 family)
MGMSDMRAKVAYLQGLTEGLELDASSPEGRILYAVLDVLGDLAEEVGQVARAQERLEQYVEDVDYDLGALEESLYGDGEEPVRCGPGRTLREEADGVAMEICPACGEPVGAVAGEMDAGDELTLICPTCGAELITDGDELTDDNRG